MKKIFVVASFAVLSGSLAPSTSSGQISSSLDPHTYTYREVDQKALSAYVFSPTNRDDAAQVGAILLFHGGGWNTGSPEWTFDTAQRFSALGMVAVSIEYRLSKGDNTPIDALADVCAAFRWARELAGELRIDPDRIAGYGVSAGGHLIATAATVGCPNEDGYDNRSRPDLLLLWSPALDVSKDRWFHKMLQGRADAVDYSPAQHVKPVSPPTSIVHGKKDTLTPLSGARRYCDAVNQAGGLCSLNVYEGVGHLLTRNLANQESDFDPDPEARANGIAKHIQFLKEMGFVTDQ